jgi:hypothetical protein
MIYPWAHVLLSNRLPLPTLAVLQVHSDFWITLYNGETATMVVRYLTMCIQITHNATSSCSNTFHVLTQAEAIQSKHMLNNGVN